MIRRPQVSDGPAMWRLARDCGRLDTNSRYFYLIWCRDFAGTSLVAFDGDRLTGFLIGYLRPDRPDTYLVWQEAVRRDAGSPGLGLRLLDHAVDRAMTRGARFCEASVTPDNRACIRMLERFSARRGAPVRRGPLFGTELFDGDHPPETLYRIGPLARPGAPSTRQRSGGAP